VFHPALSIASKRSLSLGNLRISKTLILNPSTWRDPPSDDLTTGKNNTNRELNKGKYYAYLDVYVKKELLIK
jgi:hypothetical protein